MNIMDGIDAGSLSTSGYVRQINKLGTTVVNHFGQFFLLFDIF